MGRHHSLKNMQRVIPEVLEQHLEVATHLAATRALLLNSHRARLLHLLRADERLNANLDGLRIAGGGARRIYSAALETPDEGVLFVAAVQAFEQRDAGDIDTLFAILGSDPKGTDGVIAALGWLETASLRGIVVELLNSELALKRFVAVAGCSVHRADPGLTSARRFEDDSPLVRARAWRTAGEIGRHELVSTAAAAIGDEDPGCRFWAAWSAVLLGDRQRGLESLAAVGAGPGPFRTRAVQLLLQASDVQAAHGWLASLAKDPSNHRWLIRGAGLIGDPDYVPWLIGQMADLKTTRLAGEAFSLITGLDLAFLDLEVRPPENFESGPNDDPNDPNVDMDEDDGLPWPDVAKIQAWWHANAHRFQAGRRYFMGQPLNRGNCIRVLKDGFQRQRIAAALYLSLLNPGTPLFEWRAPARRQQRLLAEMS
jgi:uncharacterized protein (TIGR02270 family)